MNTIFTQDSDPRARMARDLAPTRPVSGETSGQQNKTDNREFSVEARDHSHRLALRAEYTVRGLEAARTMLDQGGSITERQAGLESLVEHTRFQDEKILTGYQSELEILFKGNDTAALDKLIENARTQADHLVKDSIIRENFAAAARQNPELLVKEIVRAIKHDGLPEMSVTRQRVLDLLR